MNSRWPAVAVLLGLGLVGSFLFLENGYKDAILINTDNGSPVGLIGGGGERIYLRLGTIYAFEDGPEKEYNVVAYTLHATRAQLNNMLFFYTQKQAEIAGYKPSEDFAKDYACLQQGKEIFDC